MNEKKISKLRWIIFIVVIIAFLGICLAGGYGLTLLVFKLTGTPPEIFSYIISAFFGLIIFVCILKLFWTLHSHISNNHDSSRDKHRFVVDKVMEALSRIARGDFSVSVPTEGAGPVLELVESVNKLAQELGGMESLRQDFISNVSHEIQSPLTSISGFTTLLKNDSLSPELRAHYLDIIETESLRLSKLSDSLLKLSSLENGVQPLTKDEFSLDKQIQNAALMLEPQWAAKNIDLSLSLKKVNFCGDESLLNQVWINLLHNAIKFTPEHGQINIKLACEENNAVFSITDTGFGMSKEDMIHIFERFYKADKSRDRSLGGNGLGLPLVKKIIELHSGTVSVESEVGKGSTFTVILSLINN